MKIKIGLLKIFCLSFLASNAQTGLYNNGILSLSATADVIYISGDFTNTSSASLTNNGQLYVIKDLVNAQSSMSAGTGKLYLNGSTMQTVSGTQPFKTFDLISNNTSGITLNNDLSVSGNHTFTSGIITTSAIPNYLIYEAGSSYSGSADTKHVNGWVKKKGSTNFTFPVGDGIYQRHVAIESIAGISEFDAKYYAPTYNTNQLQFPLLSVDAYEYWRVNKISGTTASVHLNWDNSKVTFPCYIITDIAVAWFDGSNWTDQGGVATGDVSYTGDITSNSLSSFGDFVIGSRSNPLPLKFLSFIAHKNRDYVDVKWVTAEEVNTDYFLIERSNDGIQFSPVFKMPAMNRFSTQEYSYKDFSYLDRVAYYRIRCVDKDGKSKLSKVVSVFESSYLQKNIHVLNPVTDEIIIRCQADDKEPTAYVLYNQAGSAIQKGNLKLKGGMDNTIRLSFKIAKGIYYLKLINAKKEFVQKLVIN